MIKEGAFEGFKKGLSSLKNGYKKDAVPPRFGEEAKAQFRRFGENPKISSSVRNSVAKGLHKIRNYGIPSRLPSPGSSPTLQSIGPKLVHNDNSLKARLVRSVGRGGSRVNNYLRPGLKDFTSSFPRAKK